MSTPLANKTTISSRLKTTTIHNGDEQKESILKEQGKIRSNMPPPSQIARNRALKTPAQPSASNSRLANLVNGFPTSLRDTKSSNAIKQNFYTNVTKTNLRTQQHQTSTTGTTATTTTTISTNNVHNSNGISSSTIDKTTHHNNNKPTHQNISTKIPPHTVSRFGRQTMTTTSTKTPYTHLNNNIASRIVAPNSRISSAASNRLNSRSSSVVSSNSSTATISKQNQQHLTSIPHSNALSNNIPNTTSVRKGLAKFSNPIECQRQYQALSLKIRQAREILEARENEIDRLQDQLKQSVQTSIGFATVVQYFAKKLKLDSDTNLLEECGLLKSQVDKLMIKDKEHQKELDAVIDDYKNLVQVEQNLRIQIESELEKERKVYTVDTENLKAIHTKELDDLTEKHSDIEKDLRSRIETLESDLTTKCKELSDITNDHECLKQSFNKLEESLTKDKDARVKYAQEKITQLQKDVDSLNSVLEMRLERVHALERDSILLTETQNELETQKDSNKALYQQLESLNAALDKRREQYENLFAEHEKIRQELVRERKERRRMTMKTEQLEFALNESCATESNMGFNSSIRDLDTSADRLV